MWCIKCYERNLWSLWKKDENAGYHTGSQLFPSSSPFQWGSCFIIVHQAKHVLYTYLPKNRSLWQRVTSSSGNYGNSRPKLLLKHIRKIANRTISFVMSVHPPAWNISVPTGQIFIKFSIWAFLKNQSRKFKFHYNLTTIMCTLHEEQHIFMIIPHSIFLRIKKCLRQKLRGESKLTFYVQ